MSARVTERDLVRRINRKLVASRRFLVAKFSRGRVSYCLASGDSTNARYEILEEDVDVRAIAARVALPLTAKEGAALDTLKRAS